MGHHYLIEVPFPLQHVQDFPPPSTGEKMKRRIINPAIMLLVFSMAHTQPTEKKSELGLALGWGAPAGNAVEYAYYLTPSHNVGGGIGFSLAGAKYAVGYRHYFMPDKGATPFLGLFLSGASGLSPVTVTINSDSAEYKIHSGIAIAPRAGFRFRTRLISWYVNTGYHFVLSGGGSEYVSGSTKESLKDFADIVALGGLELGGGMLFRF
jgi:hypothetical protein